MRRSVTRLFCCTSLLLFPFLGVSRADGPLDLVPELVNDQEIPGVPGRLAGWWNPKTNAGGDILFEGRMQIGSGGNTQSGIFLKRDGVIRKVLLVGDDLPDGAGKAASAPSAADLGENGAVAIVYRTQGVLLQDTVGLHWLVRTPASVPGTSLSIKGLLGVTGRQGSYMRPLLLEGNRVVFQAELSDDSTGLFVADENGLQPILLGGDTVPGRTTQLHPQSFFRDAEAAGAALVFSTVRRHFLFPWRFGQDSRPSRRYHPRRLSDPIDR